MRIQASLNSLMSNTWRGVAALAGGIKAAKKLGLDQKKNNNNPKSETTGSMGNILQIRPIKRAAHYAAIGQESAQGMINEKAYSKNFSIEERVKQAQEASSLSIIKQEEDKE